MSIQQNIDHGKCLALNEFKTGAAVSHVVLRSEYSVQLRNFSFVKAAFGNVAHSDRKRCLTLDLKRLRCQSVLKCTQTEKFQNAE